MSDSYKIYDFDEIWKSFDFTNKWESEVMKRALLLSTSNAKKNISTVILGLIRPQVVKKFVLKSVLEIKFCLLTVTVEERSSCLKKRGATQELIGDIEELVNLEKWLKKSGYPFFKLDTTRLSIKKVLKSLTTWISLET